MSDCRNRHRTSSDINASCDPIVDQLTLQIRSIADSVLESCFTINTRDNRRFYSCLKRVWDKLKLSFRHASLNTFKSNWKRKVIRKRGKQASPVIPIINITKEAKIICIGGISKNRSDDYDSDCHSEDDNNEPEDNTTISYILDYEEYVASMDILINEYGKEWLNSNTCTIHLPPSMLRALCIHNHPLLLQCDSSKIKYYPREIELTVCTTRLQYHRYNGTIPGGLDEEDVDIDDDDGDTCSLIDYANESGLKSLTLMNPDDMVIKLRLDGTCENLYKIHPYRLSAIVFVLSVHYHEEIFTTTPVCTIYHNLRKLVGGVLTSRKYKQDDRIDYHGSREEEYEYERIRDKILEQVNDEMTFNTTNSCTDGEDIEEALWNVASDMFSDLSKVLMYGKQKSPLELACKKKGRFEKCQAVYLGDWPGTLAYRVVQGEEPNAIIFDRSLVSPLDLHTSIQILLLRFKEEFAADELQPFRIEFDDQYTILHTTSPTIFKTLEQCIIPFICSNPSFISRSIYPTPLYVLYATNLTRRSNEEEEDLFDNKRVVYSMKAIVKNFDKTKGIYDAKFWASPDNALLVHYYRDVFPAIIERIFEENGQSNKKLILNMLTDPYNNTDYTWYRRRGSTHAVQNASRVKKLKMKMQQSNTIPLSSDLLSLLNHDDNEEEEDEEAKEEKRLLNEEKIKENIRLNRLEKEEEMQKNKMKRKAETEQDLKERSTAKTKKVSGFREGCNNIYTAIKAFAYIHCTHNMKGQTLLRLYHLFMEGPSASLLQLKYQTQFLMILKMMDTYERDKFPEVVDIVVGDEFTNDYKRYYNNNTPLHMLFYDMCSSNDIEVSVARDLFLSIGCKYAADSPMNISSPHPNIENMHSVKYKLMETLYNNNNHEEKQEITTKYPSLYYLLQGMEELFYTPLMVVNKIVPQDDSTTTTRQRSKKLYFEEWFDFAHPLTTTNTYDTRNYPIQYDPITQDPLYSHQLFPIWPSEIYQSTLPTSKQYISNSNTTPEDRDIMPFAGCHDSFLECVIINPITHISSI